MSELREALEAIRDLEPESYSGDNLWLWRRTVLARATQALDAASDMDKLVEHIESRFEWTTALYETYPVSRRYRNRAELYKDLLDYIRTKFYKGGGDGPGNH